FGTPISLAARLSTILAPTQPKPQLQMAHALLAMLPLPILARLGAPDKKSAVLRQTIKLIW
ncbi:hypothetical protein M9458_048493, partial [Cirrhinus mrigala]